jgi:hypothetical protein
LASKTSLGVLEMDPPKIPQFQTVKTLDFSTLFLNFTPKRFY